MCSEVTINKVEKENKGLFGECSIFRAGHQDEAASLQMGILQFGEFFTLIHCFSVRAWISVASATETVGVRGIFPVSHLCLKCDLHSVIQEDQQSPS